MQFGTAKILLAATFAIGPGLMESTAWAAPTPMVCDDPSLLMPQLTMADAGSATQGLNIDPESGLRLTGQAELSGPCLDSLSFYRGAYLIFANGVILTQLTGRAASPPPNPSVTPELLVHVLQDRKSVPNIADETLEVAVQVDSRRSTDGLTVYYVGVWRKGEQSTVGSFSVSPAGRIGAIKSLLRSTNRIESVAFTADLDTPTGVLTAIQHLGAHTRLLRFSWDHRTAFSG